MKTKPTVTIDEELLHRAKQIARSRDVSLSGLVEEALQNLSAGGNRSFSQRWRGAFRPASRRDERYRLLARKHL